MNVGEGNVSKMLVERIRLERSESGTCVNVGEDEGGARFFLDRTCVGGDGDGDGDAVVASGLINESLGFVYIQWKQ